jgi:hypothetical protein
VAAMLSVGLVWALAKGWQLTMVGLAIAPVFAGAMAFQTGLVAKCELRTKRATEEVAMSYYEVSFFLLFSLLALSDGLSRLCQISAVSGVWPSRASSAVNLRALLRACWP